MSSTMKGVVLCLTVLRMLLISQLLFPFFTLSGEFTKFFHVPRDLWLVTWTCLSQLS